MSKFLLSLQKFGGLANLDPHYFLAKNQLKMSRRDSFKVPSRTKTS